MVFTQEKKSESTITIVRTEVIMDEDGATEKLNAVEKNGTGDGLPAKKFANAEEEELFDSLIEKIGNDGKFQRRFDILYNFILVMCVSMPYLNIILIMTIPDHWCYLPGREMTNLTVEQWKEEHIPRDPVKLNNGFSSCKMYLDDDDNNNSGNRSIVDCRYGWEYDRTWYTETAPTAQNWVCDKEVYVSNAFAAGRIGEIVGTLIFGQLGDQLGRMPVFYISMVILIVGRIASTFVSQWYYAFLVLIGLGSTASISTFQSPLVISMEVSDARKRSYVAFLQCVGWVIGLCVLAMMAWVLKDWQLIMVVSTLPCLAYFFMYKMFPESPRWLASKGRVKQAAEVLKYIARVNKTTYPDNAEEVLQKIADKKEKFYGLPTLFFHWRLAKNTLLIITCWGISGLSYYILMLNVTTMSGNPFMNFFWQSLVELPGYTLGKVCSNVFGRRWTQAGAYILGSFFCSIVLLVLPLQMPLLEIFFVSLLKMCLTTSFYMVWLQAIEIYPTCVRQTGTSLGGMVSNTVGIVGPYVVLLGTSYHASIPYAVILIGTMLSCVCASFLPETYNEKLPETLEDAQNFGKDQKFWNFKIYRKK
ncbi:UNVERIFIED_CONTAM: hypothetical protein PYX00_008558 [Menopon gallinae]|uniref:Major facilitator superfamily (MFS) profile domain-containing protein n=1 Tax=Menopon gallinae TaxID=328185 RepID=A0AAW2HPN6_9NEOP